MTYQVPIRRKTQTSTPMQEQIERIVTSGGGYTPQDSPFMGEISTYEVFGDTREDVQTSLVSMDVRRKIVVNNKTTKRF